MNVVEMFDLSNKVAIVTGGSGLYGQSISLALAEAGAQVIVASRDVEDCKAYANKLVQLGYKVEGMSLDLSSEESITHFTAEVLEKYGGIDVLVNNAVSRAGFKNLDNMSKSDWEAAQNVNSTGLMIITREVVRAMIKMGKGNIINIGSIQGVVGPNFEVYGSTGMTSPVNYTYDKWGMVGFTKWLSNFYAKQGIRVNCISPGGFGPGIEAMEGKEEFMDNYLRLTPMKRFANEDDIKGPILFLASEASAYVTGHNLVVDGGWTSW